MFRSENSPEPIFLQMNLHLDLSTIEPSVAGPRRPQDLILLRNLKEKVARLETSPIQEGGCELDEEQGQ